MLIRTTLTCPWCEAPLTVSGGVTGGGAYTLGEYGPPNTVLFDPIEVEDIQPHHCPTCAHPIEDLAAEALFHHYDTTR